LNKTISVILILTTFFCLLSVPCLGVETDFIVNTKVDVVENIITIDGMLPVKYGKKWATYYLLYPHKTIDDVPLDSPDNPVVARNGQFKADKNGVFSETFRVSGEEGEYALYIRSGDIIKTTYVNTEYDYDRGFLWQMHMLGDTFLERTEADTKKLFHISRSELPTIGSDEEIPVVEPFPVTGLYSVFVDPVNGNDETATGSIDKPFKTCAKACTAYPAEEGMVLTLRGGTYPASDKIHISKIVATEQAPFVITAYKNEEVVFTSGTVLNGDDFKKVTDKEILARLNPAISENIRVIDMADYGITEFGSISTDYTPALWVDGSEYTIARWPNAGTTGMRECTDPDLVDTVGGTATKSNGVIDCGTITVAVGSSCGEYRKYSKRATEMNIAASTDENGVVQYKENGELLNIVSTDTGAEFMVEDIHPFSWVNTGDIWFYGSVYEEWRRMNFKVAEFNPETRSIRTAAGNEWGAKYYPTHNKFYYFNILEELDAPGEWFLDKETGLLYVYPTEELSGKEIIYDATKSSGKDAYRIHLTNAQNVIINGITFKNSRGNGIYVSGGTSEHVIIQNCKFYNMRMGVTIAGRYSGIIDSIFKDLGGRAITLNTPNSADAYNLIPARQFAMNNILYNTTGINSGGIGNVISHNFISNNVGSAIRPSGSETICEYNEIVSGPREVLDSGAIYTGGNAFKRGVHVRYNYIHDIGNISPRGIYFDDMISGCYAYGNIVDGAWMQLHGARENAVYNNIFLNYQNGTKGAIRLDTNYYVNGKSEKIRWKTGNLEYGSMTAPIKPGSKYNRELFMNRYPILKTWIPMMEERIAEYQVEKDPYNSKIYQSENYPGFTDNAHKKYNLNEYLSASRDNYFGNNVLINTHDIVAGQDGKTEGYVNTGYENNLLLSAEESPFTGENYGDSNAYDKILERNPYFEPIQFYKIGLTSHLMYTKNEKTTLVKPANKSEVPTDGLTLQWKYVIGAQRYKVELATDEAFTDIVDGTTTVEYSYPVQADLTKGKTYYWRVTTIPDAVCATGSEMVSDTYSFTAMTDTTLPKPNDVGVTDYRVTKTDEGTVVSAYGFNLTDSEKQVDIYVAAYDDEDTLLDVGKGKAYILSKEFSDKIEVNLNISDFDTIKLFTWTENSLVPVTFPRKIQK